MSKHYTHLDLSERRQIYLGLEAKKSVPEIAESLGRHRATIFRELQRNTFYHEDHFNNGYFHMNAQELARRRRSKLGKLAGIPALKDWVVGQLNMLWTPEQIAGDLKLKGLAGFRVSHETIYSFIYGAEGRSLNLYRCLERAFKNRRRRFERKPRHLRGIPQNMGIRHRPAVVETRQDFGHWEGDLINFSTKHGQANVTTLVERKSRYTVLLGNQDRKSEPVLSRIRDRFSSLPRHFRQSITFDRGSEFMAWPLLEKHIELGSFYCDPRSPWQKGTNENTNGRIRRFLPRETNINEITASDLNAISWRLNHTPRKCLGYRTPHAVFYSHLHQQAPELSSLPNPSHFG
jgi:transposase, IS30 family